MSPANPKQSRFALTALYVMLGAGLSACGGGGGGDSAPVTPQPKGPLTVTVDPVVAGSNLVLRISLVAGAVGPAEITYATSSPTANTGDATGGDRCNSVGVDYVAIASGTVSVPAGASSTTVNITTCENTGFEPNEGLELTTSFEGRNTRNRATLLNTTAGGLNDSGMNQCLNSANALVACSASDLAGQDGQLGRDAQALTNNSTDGRVGFSYAVTATDCLTDKVTGLVWDKASASASTLAAAQGLPAAANAAVRCGRSDWRLPTADELMSLVDAGISSGARIDPQFGTTAAVPAWSASAYAADTRAAWVVDFGSGAVAFETATNPLAKTFAARLVAGAAPTAPACDEAATDRYTEHGNGTVTDKRTGLMWQQCVDGLSGTSCGTGSATTHANFGAALARATAVNNDSAGAGRGFSDWRVPNRNELASLVNLRCTSPAIQRSRFPGTPATSSWTSTPLATAGLVWYVDFSDGNVAPSGSTGNRVLRLVRAGQ